MRSPDNNGEESEPSCGVGVFLGKVGNKETGTGFQLGEIPPPFLALGVTVSRGAQASEGGDMMVDSYDCYDNAEQVWTIRTEDASD